MLTTLVSLLLDVMSTLLYLKSTFGIRCTRVPAKKRNDGGPSPTFEYSHNLNHIDSTSGSEFPMCGGLQLQIPDGKHESDCGQHAGGSAEVQPPWTQCARHQGRKCGVSVTCEVRVCVWWRGGGRRFSVRVGGNISVDIWCIWRTIRRRVRRML